MMMINTYRWEWTTLGALIAPRPMLFANSDNDAIFPMPGNRRIMERLRRLYKMYDKPDLVDEHVSVGGHDYRPDLRLAIFKWFDKHLRGEVRPIEDAQFEKITGKDLRVFPEDTDLPKDSLNDKIDETFVARAELKPPTSQAFTTWRDRLLQQLRERSFRVMPDRVPAAGEVFRAGKPGTLLLNTESAITIEMTGTTFPGKDLTVTLIVQTPEDDKADAALEEEYAKSGPVHRLRARPGKTGTPPNYLERACALIGTTVDTGRVRDVTATARFLVEKNKGGKVRAVGRGQAGILAAYAALFEPAIAEVVALDPPASHKDGPFFLNVLRVCDIPDALGLLAPRPLTLVNAKDTAYERTAAIYQAAGAGEKLQRK
jgi:hypothetical protein